MPIVNQGWAYINASSSTTAPGGFDQDIQFNHHGAFSGSGLLTTDGTGSLSASVNISASAFYGDGTNLTGLTASAVNVADGPEYAIQFRKDSPVTGEISGSGDLMWITGSTDFLQVTGAVKVAGFISASTSVSASEYYIQGGNSFFFGSGNTHKITRNGTNLDVNSGGNVILNAGSGHVSASTNFSASSFYGIDAYLTRDLNVCEGTASIAHLSGCSPIGLHASFSASDAGIPMIIGNPTIGNDCSNVVTIGSRVTASCDFLFESRAHFSGPSAAVTASCDVLFESQVTASTGISSSLLILNPFSGSIAGPGSYLGLDANNRVVVTGSDAGVPSPGGSNTQVQFNDAGAFQGDSGLVYNKTTDTLTAVRVTASNGIDPQGPGTNSIQVGDASARTTNAIAIGNSAVAESVDSIAIGPAASSSMHHSIAIGDGAKNFTNPGAAGYAISIGVNAESNEPGDIAIGSANGIPTHADGGIAIGQQARALSAAGAAIAIGNSATGSRSGALAIGYNAFATASSGYYPTAIGYSAQATAANTIALGSGSINATANSMTIGSPTQGMDFNITGNVTILNNEDTSYGHLNVCQGTASIAHLSGCSPIQVHAPMVLSAAVTASAGILANVNPTAGPPGLWLSASNPAYGPGQVYGDLWFGSGSNPGEGFTGASIGLSNFGAGIDFDILSNEGNVTIRSNAGDATVRATDGEVILSGSDGVVVQTTADFNSASTFNNDSATFNAGATFNNTTATFNAGINSNNTVATFNAGLNANDTATFNSNLNAYANTTIGNAHSDNLEVNASASFNNMGNINSSASNIVWQLHSGSNATGSGPTQNGPLLFFSSASVGGSTDYLKFHTSTAGPGPAVVFPALTIFNNTISASSNVSGAFFYGDGSNLTGIGGGGIFTEINATQAATTSSVAIGKATAPEGVFQVSGSLETGGNALVKVSGDGGNDIFVVTGSGRVGIGTAAPSRQLDLQGTSAAYMEFNATSHRRYTIGSEGSGFIIFDDTEGGTPGYRLCISDTAATLGYIGIGKGLLSPKAQLHVSSSLDVSNNGVLRVDGDASESILFVTGSGRVGIGTASPAATLTVAGSGSFSGSEASGHDLYFGSGTSRTLGTSLEDGDDYLVLAHTAGGIDVSASEGVTLITAPGAAVTAYSAGDFNFQVADANMNMVFKATSEGNVTISSSADNMLLQAFGTRGAASVLAVTGAQGVGINTSSPRVALDVHYSGNLNPTNLGDDKGGGEVVYFGTAGGDLAAGGLYYLDTDGAWKSTNASVTGSGHDQLLGVAMADGKPAAVGMLVKGYFHQDSYFSGSFGVGKPVYIQSSSVARSATEGGFMSGAAPTSGSSYVRVIGYGTSTANVIYFNPDATYVEIG